MPGWDGLKATRLIKEEMPYVKIVMLTVSDDDQDLFEAIKWQTHRVNGWLVPLRMVNATDWTVSCAPPMQRSPHSWQLR